MGAGRPICVICGQPIDTVVIYKPIAGEQPLWDFPDGCLAHREVAAYLVSQALGWNIVPRTWLRDGPFGEGIVQLWEDTDPEQDRGPGAGRRRAGLAAGEAAHHRANRVARRALRPIALGRPVSGTERSDASCPLAPVISKFSIGGSQTVSCWPRRCP